MSIMIDVPKFKHKLGSAQGKAERLDWVILQLKKNMITKIIVQGQLNQFVF